MSTPRCGALYLCIYCALIPELAMSILLRAVMWCTLLVATPLLAGNVGTVTVFAAASLKEAMDDQARQFQARSGEKVIVSYAASNALAKQIEAGAPADIFISADL